ncbi:hypothetical protein V8E52_006223 [Russula decolorans]|jgi:hypothetical protein
MHSRNPRPIVSILILFTKLFSCFLCVLVIFSIGTRVAVLWFLLFAGSLRYLACTFYFLLIAMYVIGGYCVRAPPLHHHPCVHPYSPPLLPTHFRFLPLLPTRVVKLLCPVVPVAFRAQSLPTHHFSILANPSLSPPVPPLSIDTPCHLFFLNVDLSAVHTALRLIITPRRPYIPLIFLLDMVIVFICVHL